MSWAVPGSGRTGKKTAVDPGPFFGRDALKTLTALDPLQNAAAAGTAGLTVCVWTPKWACLGYPRGVRRLIAHLRSGTRWSLELLRLRCFPLVAAAVAMLGVFHTTKEPLHKPPRACAIRFPRKP